MNKQDYNKLKELSKKLEIIRVNNNLSKLELISDNGFIKVKTSENK